MVIGLTIQTTHVWQKSSHKIWFYVYLLSLKYFPLKVFFIFSRQYITAQLELSTYI